MSAINNADNRYPLNEERLQLIEKEVEGNNYKKARGVLAGFAVDQVTHSFLREQPDLCVRFLPIMWKGQECHHPKDKTSGTKETGINPELASKVVKQFINTRVFESKALAEDVAFVTGDGSVKMSKEVLQFRSNFFAIFFKGPGFTDSAQIEVSHDISSNMISKLKEYMYFNTFPKMKAEETLGLYILADLYELDDLKSKCVDHMNLLVEEKPLEPQLSTFRNFAKKLPEEKCRQFELKLVTELLKTQNCAYELSDHGLILPIAEWFRLEMKSELAQFINSYTVGYSIIQTQDCDLLSQLNLLSKDLFNGIRILKFEYDISSDTIKKLLKSFSNLKEISASCSKDNVKKILHYLSTHSEIKKITVNNNAFEKCELIFIDLSQLESLLNNVDFFEIDRFIIRSHIDIIHYDMNQINSWAAKFSGLQFTCSSYGTGYFLDVKSKVIRYNI